jgi:hypothetical protein
MQTFYRHFAAAIAATAIALPCFAGSQTITIREQLNQTYARELVSVPFAASSGACAPDSFALTGPDGAVPVQVADIVFRSKKRKHVQAATVWFVVEHLAPLSSQTYTLTWGRRKAKQRPATDLALSTKDGIAEVATARIAARFPIGDDKSAPAPLAGMRLGTGSWSAASSWQQAAFSEWSGAVSDSGPVFVRHVSRYTTADGLTAAFTATVVAGDNSVRWELAVSGGAAADTAATFVLPAVPGVKTAALPKGYGQWARDRKKAVSDADGGFVALAPNTSLVNIFADNPHRVVLKGGETTLELRSAEPGAWVKPGPAFTYGPTGLHSWDLEMIGAMWKDGWQAKTMPVRYRADGTVTLTANLAAGRRLWRVSNGAPAVGDQLQRVRDMVLDWTAADKHPRLFMDMQEIKEVWARAAADKTLNARLKGRYAAAALAVLRKPADQRQQKEIDAVVKTLRQRLAMLGNYDVMRGGIATVSLYDALIDSDLISDTDRALFRAQMAYHAYLMADPMCWSSEHGYGSGNPNMHCSYTLTLGVMACALRDHPMAKEWSAKATGWLNKWLDAEVGENGEWIPEGSHYGIVSFEPQLTYAIAAKRAGFHDFTDDPRLKREALFFTRTHTPPDVQRRNHRVTGAWGRGTSGDTLAVQGIIARMTVDSDPAFSAEMQWAWAQIGSPGHLGDHRLGGYEGYYLDHTLPQQQPLWPSTRYPELGAFLRAGFATERESYVVILAGVDSQRNLDVWTPGIGDISHWFGLGKPLSTCFTTDTGYKVRHDLLAEGPRLARNYAAGEVTDPFGYYTTTDFKTFAALNSTDYIRTEIAQTHVDSRAWRPPKVPSFPKVTPAKSDKLAWTRQVLFSHNADAPYLVVRDTTSGGEPTAWQFWTLSEKIGTPKQTADVDAFLADKPGEKILDARELPKGQRYTALGQFGVDVEYFIAEPAATPRHTVRYGGNNYRKVPEWQDALLLQQPGDGSYYLAIVPRARGTQAPSFGTSKDGKIIVIDHLGGRDYAFLSATQTTAAMDAVTFKGTSGSVSRVADSQLLVLGAAGSVAAGDHALAAGFAAELTVTGGRASLQTPPDSPGGELTVTVSGKAQQVTVPPGGGVSQVK